MKEIFFSLNIDIKWGFEMSEEFLDARERDLLDYVRNNITDPEDRGIDVTESHIATASQTVFTLKNVLVKNVADTILLDAVTLRKGYDYYVTYGEGKNTTIITLLVAATVGQVLQVVYHFGESLVEREFSRSDVKLPRIVMMFLTASEEYAALGDVMEEGTGTYIYASYRFEIRDKYASRARNIASKVFNLPLKMRHATIFRTLITTSRDLQNFDYDYEKEAYVWQFTFNIQWEELFA
jgi:hypothetical protein